MKKNRKFQRDSRIDDEQKKLLSALVIPLIVIVLILVIVVADRCGREELEEDPAETVTTVADTMAPTEAVQTEDEAGAPEDAETSEAAGATDAFSAENFERDGIPEILDLMKKYFEARATADAVAMNQLYGIGEDEVSVTALEAQKTRMRSNSKYVTGFEDIATYVKPGKDADSWLVYTTAQIKFRSVTTTAPMIMWCYVTRDGEGNYLLVDNNSLSADILNYVDAAGRSEEVRRLAADVNTRLKTALNEDSDLKQVYGILNSDSPLWVDEDPDTEPEVVILGDETSEAETSEPSSEGIDNSGDGRNSDEVTTGAEETSVAGATSAAAEPTAAQ